MLLNDLFERLATGELSQHFMGKTGKILPENYPAIINRLNMGLTSLYSYFPISEKEVIVQQFDAVTEYKLNSTYAVSNTESTVPNKWVIDSVDNPFLDDVIRLERAYNELGSSIALNDEYDGDSVFTTAWDTVQIPFPVAGNVTVLVYRANHVKLSLDADPLTTVIEIPPALEEALQAFIASRLFVSLGQATSAGLASYYSNRYQQQVDHVERNNLLQSTEGDSNLKLEQKGFI